MTACKLVQFNSNLQITTKILAQQKPILIMKFIVINYFYSKQKTVASS